MAASELIAIITGMICTFAVLSMLPVFGGYLFVTRCAVGARRRSPDDPRPGSR